MSWRLLQFAEARDDLRNPQIGGVVDAEGMLELCRAAGYSEDEAQRAASARGFERIKRGMPA